MPSFTHNQGIDAVIGPDTYANNSFTIGLITDVSSSINNDTTYADLTQPTGTGYAPIVFADSTKWVFEDGVCTYSLARTETAVSATLDIGFAGVAYSPDIPGAAIDDEIMIWLDDGTIHTATLIGVATGAASFDSPIAATAQIGNRVVIREVDEEGRFVWTNSGGSNWSAPVTGAIIYETTTNKLLHTVTLAEAVTMTPGQELYVDLETP